MAAQTGQTGQKLYDASKGSAPDAPNPKYYRFFEIARVLVHFDHVASVIVNADHGVV